MSRGWKKFFKAAVIVFALLILTDGLIYFFGTPIVRKLVSFSVTKLTDSLYVAKVNKVHYEFFTQSFYITDFKLSPNLTKRTDKNLYEFEFKRFDLVRIHLFKLLLSKQLYIDKVKFTYPDVAFYKLRQKIKTDSVPVSYQLVKHDFLSSFFQVLNGLRIKKIVIEHGKLAFLKKLQNTFKARDITLVMDDFNINKQNFSQNSLFVSDFKIIMQDYSAPIGKYQMLLANKLIIDSKKKYIRLFNTKFFPRVLSDTNNLISLSVRDITLNNTDFKQIYLDKVIDIHSIRANGMTVSYYNQKHKRLKKRHLPTAYDLYQMFKSYLHYIKVDTIAVRDVAFSLYDSLSEEFPRAQVRDMNLVLYGFYADSANAFDTSRVFFAKNAIFDMHDFWERLNDGIHFIRTKFLEVNTLDKKILSRGFLLNPLPSERVMNMRSKRLMSLRADSVLISGFNLPHIVHSSRIDLRSIVLGKSDFRISLINYKPVHRSGKSRTKTKALLKNFRNISVGELTFNGSDFTYVKVSKGQRLLLHAFLVLRLRRLFVNPLGKFSINNDRFGNLWLALRDLNYDNSKSLHQISLDSLVLDTRNRNLQVVGLKIVPKPNSDTLARKLHRTLRLNFYLPQFSIYGFNLDSLIYKRKVEFADIITIRPKLKLIFSPEYSAKKQKQKLLKYIRLNAIGRVLHLSSVAYVEVYKRYKKIDSVAERQLQAKYRALDSIQSFAVNMISNIALPLNKVSLSDTSSPIVNRILRITEAGFKAVASLPGCKIGQLDTIVSNTIARLEYMQQSSELKFLSFKELSKIMKTIVTKIAGDSIVLNSAQISFIKQVGGKYYDIFGNEMNVKLLHFRFNPDSLSLCKKNLFCSKSLWLEIKNYHFSLPDSVHKLIVGDLIISTADSLIMIRNMQVRADSAHGKAKFLIFSYIPRLDLQGVDFGRLLDSNRLIINRLYVPKSFVHLYSRGHLRAKKHGKVRLKPFVLPAFVRVVKIGQISIDSTYLRYESNRTGIDFSGVAELSFNGFYVDSVYNPSRYVTYLPVRKYRFVLHGLSFSKPGIGLSSNYVSFDSDGKILFGKTSFSTKKLKFYTDSLIVNTLNLAALLTNRKVIVDSFGLINPRINLAFVKAKNHKAKKSISFDLRKVDVYKFIRPYIKCLNVRYLWVDNLDFNSPKAQYDSLYLFVKRLLIDSTTSISEPNLLYCQDARFEIRNFRRRLNQFYSLRFSRAGFSLDKRRIYLDSLYYYTNGSFASVAKKLKWRKTLLNLFLPQMSVNNIDWKKLLFDKQIIAQNILLDNMLLQAYADRGIPHDYSKRKKHFVQMLMHVPVPLDIRSVIVRNGKIVYFEKAPKGTAPGRIELDNLQAIISNVTNSTHTSNPYINLRLSTLLQGEGLLQIYGFFKLDTLHCPFKIYGTLGRMDLKAFNSFLVNDAFLEITSGRLRNAQFVMTGQDSIVLGVLRANYKNLKVSILKPSKEFAPKRRGFLSFVADVVVRNENPKYGILFKQGTIAYVHDNSFSDIRFWVKGVLSGVKSLVLFENKHKYRKLQRLMYGRRIYRKIK